MYSYNFRCLCMQLECVSVAVVLVIPHALCSECRQVVKACGSTLFKEWRMYVYTLTLT
jgi:hypothetical protein